MSKPVNPMAIGGFTVGALVLLVVGLLMFGGGQFFNADKIRYVIFFDSSLNGLEVGAPVKMQGVKIGTVTEVKLELDPNTAKVYKPVVVEIDRKSFVGMEGRPEEISNDPKRQKANADKMVKEGFRARLEMQSLLTGLLYVDFGMYPDKPAQYTRLNYQGLVELPCIPTTVDELRSTAESMMEKLRDVPLDKMVADFSETLREIRNLLGSKEMQRSNAALTKTLEGMEKTLATLNQNLEPILRESKATVTSANALVQDSRSMVNDVHRDVRPVLAGAEKSMAAATTALDTANATLQKAQSAIVTVEGAVGPDSALNETLLALKNAARSVKNLTDYLERHPESLVFGKGR